jgi:hypothetical protein
MGVRGLGRQTDHILGVGAGGGRQGYVRPGRQGIDNGIWDSLIFLNGPPVFGGEGGGKRRSGLLGLGRREPNARAIMPTRTAVCTGKVL